jgi:formate--tetrahydrofolate ligase
VGAFGLSPVVAINAFPSDTEQELALVRDAVAKLGAHVAPCDAFALGGEGALSLAQTVCEVADATDADPPAPRFAYELADSAEDKIRKVARSVYGAQGVMFTSLAEKDLMRVRELGYGQLPVCVAKTQLSLTDDPTSVGRPRDFVITVQRVRLSAGAGYLVPLTGEMTTMPGLPRVPAARNVRLLPDGEIKGLMQND